LRPNRLQLVNQTVPGQEGRLSWHAAIGHDEPSGRVRREQTLQVVGIRGRGAVEEEHPVVRRFDTGRDAVAKGQEPGGAERVVWYVDSVCGARRRLLRCLA